MSATSAARILVAQDERIVATSLRRQPQTLSGITSAASDPKSFDFKVRLESIYKAAERTIDELGGGRRIDRSPGEAGGSTVHQLVFENDERIALKSSWSLQFLAAIRSLRQADQWRS